MWDLSKFEKNIAIVEENGNEVSYKEFNDCCNDLISNINGRCLVFNLCTNNLGSLVGYIGFLSNNIVPLMLSADMDSELLYNFMETYKPDYLNLPSNLVKNFPECKKIYSNLDYTLVKTPYNNEYNLHEDLALLLTTSGSTGSPKLVRQSYENIKANTDSIIEYLALDESERAITTLPMNYTYGISIINTHLAVGASLILTDKGLMQKEFWQQLKEFEATSFGGVPYTYEMLDRLRFYRMTLPNLRYMTQAGGKLSPELHNKFARWTYDNDKQFIVMYGQTEATARMSYLPAEKSVEKYGSMGVAIPGGKFSLMDVEGNEINTPETVGELVYQGDNVTLGYAECGEDLGKGDERNKKLVTGDMAKFDEDGFFYIVGRKKRFLKIFGNRVNLDQTEMLIKKEFPGVSCACAGRDDLMSIFVTDCLLKDEILSFITQKTGLNKAAFCVNYIEDIPKNDSGKTLYVELEKVL